MTNKIYGYIYKITNLINNKVYIGQTKQKNPKNRWYCHISHSKINRPLPAISRAIKKHGKQNFSFEIIDIAYSAYELNLLEGKYIFEFKSLTTQNGYNITNIIDSIHIRSEETIKKHVINHRAKKQPRAKSSFFGVGKLRSYWQAFSVVNNKTIYLGVYNTEIEAAQARDISELKYLGDNAILNFPNLKNDYINNNIIPVKRKKNQNKKSNSNIVGVCYDSKRNKWKYNKNNIQKRFKTKEEAEEFAQKLASNALAQ